MAFSPDGRELALLWDFAPPDPLRQLVYMNATNGKIIKVVEGLLPAADGFAHKQPRPDRDLFWLDENAGWVVNLQQVVDAETGAVLDITPPAAGEGGARARSLKSLQPGMGDCCGCCPTRPPTRTNPGRSARNSPNCPASDRFNSSLAHNDSTNSARSQRSCVVSFSSALARRPC